MLVTIATVFWTACVAGEFEHEGVRAFDAAVHSCNCRQLVLILLGCFLKPAYTNMCTADYRNETNLLQMSISVNHEDNWCANPYRPSACSATDDNQPILLPEVEALQLAKPWMASGQCNSNRASTSNTTGTSSSGPFKVHKNTVHPDR